MTALTAKPFTARPLAARPFTAYPFGESTSVSNPLVWLAAYPDADGVMQAQLRGEGSPVFAVDDGLLLPGFDGVYYPIEANTPPWHGARKVVNKYTYSEDLTNSVWNKSDVTLTSGVSDPEGGTTAFTLTATGTSGRIFRGITAVQDDVVESWWIRRRTGTGTIHILDGTLTGTDVTSAITGEWQRISALLTPCNATSRGGIRFYTIGDEIDVWHPQYEIVTGQANQNPSEYVPTDIAKAGASELVTNGGFDSGTTGWTVNASATVTPIGDGTAQVDGFTGSAGFNSLLYNPVSVIAGKRYIVSCPRSVSAGNISMNVYGAGPSTSSLGTVPATGYVIVTAAGSTIWPHIYQWDATAGDLVAGPLSVKEATPGYAYYSYENGNTVSSNVVTEAQGATLDPLPSLYGAPSYTNSLTYSNDLTNAAWVKTAGCTAAQTQVGITGSPNTATLLTDDTPSGENARQTTSISTSVLNHVFRVFIAKDTDETRFPAVYVTCGSSSILMHINTKTGAKTNRIDTGTVDSEVVSAGSMWECMVSVTNTSAATNINTILSPADGSTFGVYSGAATGSIIVGNVELHLNKSIAQVRGSAPIITAASTVTTTAISMSYDIANHSDTQGAYYAEFVSDDYTPSTGIVSTYSGSEPIFYNEDKARTYSVGSGFVVGASIVDGSTVKAGVAYGEQEGSLNIITDGSVGTAGTSFAGFRNNLTRIDIGSAATVPVRVRNIRRYNLNYDAAVAKLVELTT